MEDLMTRKIIIKLNRDGNQVLSRLLMKLSTAIKQQSIDWEMDKNL